MEHNKQCEFTFTFGTKGERSVLRAPITIPLNQSVEEFVQRLICAHHLPCFVEGALRDELAQFVSLEQRKFQDEVAEKAIEGVQNGDTSVDVLVNQWVHAFSEGVLEYARPEPLSNEVVFSEVYHALIHSPALEPLLNLEHTYSLAVTDITCQRDRDLGHLEKRQRENMEEAIKKLGSSYTDDQINIMAQRHFENIQLIESKWASELSNLQETQRREYREWVMNLHEDSQAGDNTPSYLNRVKALSSQTSSATWNDEPAVTTSSRQEESFTVHLGAQMKTMHNLRIISCDVLDFGRHSSFGQRGDVVSQPQRLQTAMSLYSNNLCGLVLLVDNRLNSYTGIKRDFAKVCEQSTDFHFPNLEQQFETIEEAVMTANEWRSQKKLLDEVDKISTGSDKISLKSNTSSSSDRDDRSIRMQPGDFYITRHSNLSEVHIVYHLVADDSVRSIQSDISSRHPVILGYRNILKACYRYDVSSITLPLLLVHEMSEEMTINWCMKRAELVFKCVKGFMMEFATWSGQESRTIQFLVPQGLSEDTFTSLSNMLPSIFRMSNPVMARS